MYIVTFCEISRGKKDLFIISNFTKFVGDDEDETEDEVEEEEPVIGKKCAFKNT